MRIYATEYDLADWMAPKPAPANAVSLLRSASNLVYSETVTAFYATDPAGMPIDAKVVEAFRDATTAQAQFWDTMKVDPTLGAAGVSPMAMSKSIGGASIQYSTYVFTAQARADAAGVLGPDAFYALQQAGLLEGFVMPL
ncbi:hypothetical protein [Arthrobacter sp. GMC3]|uniref:hypothetical protein n=1 Tax=Arthrobacter sp. GMC3 TaxID=2058894 RepID=UPI000CE50D23|nr:hypothetical protein [Arthrobacter sp. GMC3]